MNGDEGGPRLSLVVPVYNAGRHLPSMWESVGRSGLWRFVRDVVMVDDGSTDESAREIEALRGRCPGGVDFRVVRLPERSGRFCARMAGAEAAREPVLLFVDCRVILREGFGGAVGRLARTDRCLMPNVDIDTSRGVFDLYWDRLHRLIFRRHFLDTRQPLLITPENFRSYLKGTTVFCAPREAFLEACARFDGAELLNDDNPVLESICGMAPILVHPEVRILWRPREKMGDFLVRLWERGPSFVEYHMVMRPGRFFLFGVVAASVPLLWGILLAWDLSLGFLVAMGCVGFIALSTLLLARSPVEFARLAPLHALVALTCLGAVVYGVVVNVGRWLRGRLPRAGARGTGS